MKYSIVLLLAVLTVSCNSNKYDEQAYDFTYKLIIKNNEGYSKHLLNNINHRVANSQNNQIKTYDSLTKNYLHYLSKLEREIEKNSSDIFFSGDTYSPIRKEYINKTNIYKTEIEKLTFSENLKKRINYVLNSNNVCLSNNNIAVADNNENNVFEKNTTYFFYLDYYIRGFPKYQTLSYFSSKRRHILELQNEYNIVEEK